jgi:hypothetical protein
VSVRSLLSGVGICTFAMLAVVAVVRGAGAETFSPGWKDAAAVAAFVCWVAALPGLVLFSMRDSPDWKLMSAGVAIILRLMVCLGALVAFQAMRHPLWKSGIGEMLVVCYLAMLVAETAYFLLFAGPPQPGLQDPKCAKAGDVNSKTAGQD